MDISFSESILLKFWMKKELKNFKVILYDCDVAKNHYYEMTDIQFPSANKPTKFPRANK